METTITEEQIAEQRGRENANRALALAGAQWPLFGGRYWVRLLNYEDAAALEFAGNALICGGVPGKRDAFHLITHTNGWVGRRHIWKRVKLRRFLDKHSDEAVSRALHEYSEVVFQDRVIITAMSTSDEAVSMDTNHVHFAARAIAYYTRNFGLSVQDAMRTPIPVLNQLRRAQLEWDGRAMSIVDKSDKMLSRLAILRADQFKEAAQ